MKECNAILIEYIISFLIGIGSSVVATVLINKRIDKKNEAYKIKILKCLLKNTKNILQDVNDIKPSYPKLLVLNNFEHIIKIKRILTNNIQNLIPFLNEKEIENLNDMLYNITQIDTLMNRLKPTNEILKILGNILDAMYDNEDGIELKNKFDTYVNSHLNEKKVLDTNLFLYKQLVENCYLFYENIEDFNENFNYIEVPVLKVEVKFRDK